MSPIKTYIPLQYSQLAEITRRYHQGLSSSSDMQTLLMEVFWLRAHLEVISGEGPTAEKAYKKDPLLPDHLQKIPVTFAAARKMAFDALGRNDGRRSRR